MELLVLKFNEVLDESEELSFDGCPMDWCGGDCGSNSCDCEYNCYSDDDCTSGDRG